MPIKFEKTDYPLVQIENQDDWKHVLSACEGYLAERDFSKLASYFADSVKTVIVEKNYNDKDFRDTYYNFYAKKFAYYPNNTIRLHFFSASIPEDELFNLDNYNDSYIGFSVIRPTKITTIGRTIINPKKLSNAAGHICFTEYKAHLLGVELTVRGFPYISQDTDVTVCAHAACWMVFRYFSERYPEYAQVLPYEVSQLTENLSYGRLVPSKGLHISQIAEMFSKFGFYPEIYSRDQHKDAFDKLLYYYIESGLPVVAGSTKRRHAITLLGHISDFNRKPNSNNSVDYLDGWIVNDDNHLPYQKLLRKGLKKEGYCSAIDLEEIDSFVVPLYEKIYFSAEYVDRLVIAVLESPTFGVDALSSLVKETDLIKRIFLTSSKSYKMKRKKDDLPHGLSLLYSQMNMPKFIWVCELSDENLYPKGEIVGEIIFDATANHYDRFAFLSIHYPDFMIINDRKNLTNEPEKFIQGSLSSEKLLSYSMYKSNLKEI